MSCGDTRADFPASGEAIRQAVRTAYGRVARRGGGCCGGDAAARTTAERIGYGEAEIQTAPEGSNLGLGCGNPAALASLRPGEVVVDLGAGAGFDAFIAARAVGPEGRVIGVDMTPEMLERARENAVRAGLARTVEFREGLIEDLPVVTDSADVVISNCVVNLSPDKAQAFREAFRVLKPGGRLAVSDIVLTEPLPQDVAQLATGWVACLGGAVTAEEYLGAIRDAGFVDLHTERVSAAPLLDASTTDPVVRAALESIGVERAAAIANTVFSYSIRARKP